MTPEELIGRNIAAARTERSGEHSGREWLSQEALGQRLAFYLGKPWTKQAVSNAETGRRHLDPTELLAFASALEFVSVAELFAAGPDDKIHLPGEVPDISGEELRWIVLPPDVANVLALRDLEREQAALDRTIQTLRERVEAAERRQAEREGKPDGA